MDDKKVSTKNKTRVIITNLKDDKYIRNNLLHFLSSQLSDGYWENDEGFHEEFWNWLKFDVKNNYLVIKIKDKPTWTGVKNIFSNKTDEEVVHYIGEVLEDCYDLAPSLFERFGYGEVTENITNELKNYSNNIEEIIFTDIDKLSKYNEKLLNEFVKYLNNKHKKTRDVFHCGASIQIVEDSEKFVKEFSNSVINNIKKD